MRKPLTLSTIEREKMDKPTKNQYSNTKDSIRSSRYESNNRSIPKDEELMTMALAEKHMASQLKQAIDRTKKRVPLSQAIKKIGVRSAFGVSAVDLHLHDRRGK